MNKLLGSLLIGAIGVLGNIAMKADEERPSQPAKTERNETRSIPFRGRLDAIDKAGGTIKVGERTFHFATTTKITKSGKPAQIDDAIVGEEAAGSYRKDDSGRLELNSLRLGPKPAAKAKSKKPQKNGESDRD